MFRSIQWTLQLWHAGLLAVVLAGFGAASYFSISQARLEQFDSDLERSVQVLAGGFQPPKPQETKPNAQTADARPAETAPADGTRSPQSQPGSTTTAADAIARDLWSLVPKPGFEVPAVLVQRFAPDHAQSDYYVIWDCRGNVLKSSSVRAAADVPYPGAMPELSSRPPAPGPPQIRERLEFREAFINGPAWTRVLYGTSTLPVETELRHLALLLTAIGAAVLTIGLLGGWLISIRAVKPIRAITSVAQEISASNLSRRIPAAEIQSELGSLAVVLNDMFARLDAAFQQQSRFTADASHELRTPLSVIHTHAQLALSRERSADEYRKTIEACLRASGRMKDLVDSLLLLAGADAGRLTLKREQLDLRSTVESCVAMVAPLAEAKGIAVETDLKDATVFADPSRLAQVTTNLLTNAIRYNRKAGSVRVMLNADGPDALLTIADTGLGIPPENQPHIFERFYRVDKARSREEGGSGLGLAICKTIVEAHGGTISFHSEVDRGSTFMVRIPLAGSESAK